MRKWTTIQPKHTDQTTIVHEVSVLFRIITDCPRIYNEVSEREAQKKIRKSEKTLVIFSSHVTNGFVS